MRDLIHVFSFESAPESYDAFQEARREDADTAKVEQLQAFGVLAYFFVSGLAGFYTVAALVGFIYAGVMPLYAVIARENFPLKMMGTVIGGTAMAGSLGMATGPLFGGLLYDSFATYSWLYVASWGIGLGAFLIAMTFRPFPKAQTGAAVAV